MRTIRIVRGEARRRCGRGALAWLGAAVLAGAAGCGDDRREQGMELLRSAYVLESVDGAPVPTVVMRESGLSVVSAVLAGSLQFTSDDSLRLALRVRQPRACAGADTVARGMTGAVELRQAFAAMYVCEDSLAQAIVTALAYERRGDSLTTFARIPRAAGRDTTYALGGTVRGDTVRLSVVIAQHAGPTGAPTPQLSRLEFVR
jgi:hypothetical protein